MGFDVSVSNPESCQIVEPLQDLEHDNFGEDRIHLFFLDGLVQVERKVVHHYVQVLFIILIC